jgi:hypothetical protein
MKKLVSYFLAISIIYLISVSCETKKDSTPPDLPPYESMFVDFSKFKVSDTKSAVEDLKNVQTDSMSNFHFAQGNVFVFSLILGVTLAVPVATFANSFNQQALFLGDATWQWSSDYEVLGGVYHARLTGQVRASDVKWVMNVSRTGIGAFDEFIWYQGTSLNDGSGGQWILNYSQQFPEPMLQIDWERTGSEVGMIKYTNVRELNDNRTANVHFNDWIEVGRTDNAMDSYYTIHVFNEWPVNDFIDVDIEWSSTEYYGHVKSELYYGNTDWHCWDGYGYDISCE